MFQECILLYLQKYAKMKLAERGVKRNWRYIKYSLEDISLCKQNLYYPQK